MSGPEYDWGFLQKPDSESGSFSHAFGAFDVEPIEGNVFAIKPRPIVASEAIDYLENPSPLGTKRRGIVRIHPGQLPAFDESIFSGQGDKDVLEGVYSWLCTNVSKMTRDELLNEITGLMGERGEEFLPVAQNYLDKVVVLGQKTKLSQSSYAIRIFDDTEVHGIGKKQKKTVEITGRTDEIRTPEGGGRDIIVKIRRRGEPNAYDAMRLALDYYAYKANQPKDERRKPEPKLMVYSLYEGTMSELIILSGSYFQDAIKALTYASLAKQAGYVPDAPIQGIADIDTEAARKHEKRAVIKRKNSSAKNLSARQVYEKAQSTSAKFSGRSGFTSERFTFVPIN